MSREVDTAVTSLSALFAQLYTSVELKRMLWSQGPAQPVVDAVFWETGLSEVCFAAEMALWRFGLVQPWLFDAIAEDRPGNEGLVRGTQARVLGAAGRGPTAAVVQAERELTRLRDEERRLKMAGQDATLVVEQALKVERRLRALSGPTPDERLGEGRFVLAEAIGAGAYGEVWTAWDELKRKRVALKILHAERARDPTTVARVRAGLARMRDLRDAGCSWVVDVGERLYEERGRVFFAMEYLPDGDLRRHVPEGGLPLDRALSLLSDLTEALELAHRLGFVHRDLNPSNVLLRDGRPRLADFDLVWARDVTLLTRGPIGTLLYSAPEVLAGTRGGAGRPEGEAAVDARADVYSLGMIALFLLQGRDPDLDWSVVNEQIEALPVEEHVRDAIYAAVAPHPEERLASARELFQALSGEVKIRPVRIRQRQARALRELVREMAGVASLAGDALVEALVEILRTWTRSTIDPDGEIAFIGRDSHGVVAEGASRALAPDVLDALDRRSQEARDKAILILPGASEMTPPAHGGVLAVPLLHPAVPRIEGHIFLFHEALLPPPAQAALSDAARELALRLDGESLRQEMVFQASLFRHGVLGPAQGLTSAARALHQLAKSHGVEDARLPTIWRRVEREAESIRLWRENQRMHMSGKLEIRPEMQPLRPIVERVFERYRSFAEERPGATVRLAWLAESGLVCAVDANLLDLALSNLLDNATRYALFNREIVVGVSSEQGCARVWVEDIGHPTPERLWDQISHPERRYDLKDPVRPLAGQGLGLPIARAILEAHRGTLSHTCEPLDGAVGGSGTRQTFRVRFEFILPWQALTGCVA